MRRDITLELPIEIVITILVCILLLWFLLGIPLVKIILQLR